MHHAFRVTVRNYKKVFDYYKQCRDKNPTASDQTFIATPLSIIYVDFSCRGAYYKYECVSK